jgi:hypothetical protein
MNVYLRFAVSSIVSSDPTPGSQIGGWGCCSGRGQGLTYGR